MFRVTLVDMLFNISGSTESIKWKGKLSNTYIRKIKIPYIIALVIPFLLLSALLVKKDTVSGIIGNTQGVSKAMNPPINPKKNMVLNPRSEEHTSELQ